MLVEAAARLDGRCRDILRRKLEGASFVEMAAEFGRPVNTVYSWDYRCLQRLKDLLAERWAFVSGGGGRDARAIRSTCWAGYATDSLGEAERNELLRAALDDQELFDALVEEEGLRELLHDPAARQEVLAVLEQPTGVGAGARVVRAAGDARRPGHDRWARGRGGRRPGARHGATVARLDSGSADRGASCPRRTSRRCSELPEKQTVPAGIEIADQPDAAFAAGEMLPVRISLRAPARVVLLLAPPSGPPSQAWPALGQAPALVPAAGEGRSGDRVGSRRVSAGPPERSGCGSWSLQPTSTSARSLPGRLLARPPASRSWTFATR